MIRFCKYQGAGNDFLIADNRDGHISESGGVLAVRMPGGCVGEYAVEALCDRRYGVGADGIMLLEGEDVLGDGTKADFRMRYFNSDGSGGMMCGNGGRCIAAFARDLGIFERKALFVAADGLHEVEVVSEDEIRIIRLRMRDVEHIQYHGALEGVSVRSDGYFLDTGTRHFVRFDSDVETTDVVLEGRDIRYNAAELLPVGTNVNFVQPYEGGIKVRTYEKGVEDETFACGTGIVASCMASYVNGLPPTRRNLADGRVSYDVRARRDSLAVDFVPASAASDAEFRATDVWLTGPAVYVAEIMLP